MVPQLAPCCLEGDDSASPAGDDVRVGALVGKGGHPGQRLAGAWQRAVLPPCEEASLAWLRLLALAGKGSSEWAARQAVRQAE